MTIIETRQAGCYIPEEQAELIQTELTTEIIEPAGLHGGHPIYRHTDPDRKRKHWLDRELQQTETDPNVIEALADF